MTSQVPDARVPDAHMPRPPDLTSKASPGLSDLIAKATTESLARVSTLTTLINWINSADPSRRGNDCNGTSDHGLRQRHVGVQLS